MKPAPFTLALPALLLALAALPGCFGGGSSEITEGPAYPFITQTETLDIQVFRDSTTLSFTNTSARVFPAARLWLNREFHRDIDGLAIGQTLTLALATFVDQYGTPFRSGGFFATEAPDKVVLAQLELDGKMLGLITVENK